jgi:hypothetical protein
MPDQIIDLTRHAHLHLPLVLLLEEQFREEDMLQKLRELNAHSRIRIRFGRRLAMATAQVLNEDSRRDFQVISFDDLPRSEEIR